MERKRKEEEGKGFPTQGNFDDMIHLFFAQRKKPKNKVSFFQSFPTFGFKIKLIRLSASKGERLVGEERQRRRERPQPSRRRKKCKCKTRVFSVPKYRSRIRSTRQKLTPCDQGGRRECSFLPLFCWISLVERGF